MSGCDRTTPGTVAMTTEPGGSTRSSTPSTSSRPTTSSPRTSTPRTSSEAPPAPGDAAAVTCRDYENLDPASQTALIEEILSGRSSVLGPGDAEIAKSLADAVCTFLPTTKVSDILLGESPP